MFVQTGKVATIAAVNSGIVAYAGPVKGGEEVIILDHGVGLQSVYGGVSSIRVSQGEKVEKGKTVAIVDKNLRVFLFEMRVQGVNVRISDWFSNNWVRKVMLDKSKEAKYLASVK